MRGISWLAANQLASQGLCTMEWVWVVIDGPRQLSQYSECLHAGRSGDRIPEGARFSARVQTGTGAHPASCITGTGSFPGVKRSGRHADPAPPSNAMVYSAYGPYGLYSASVPAQGVTFTFFIDIEFCSILYVPFCSFIRNNTPVTNRKQIKHGRQKVCTRCCNEVMKKKWEMDRRRAKGWLKETGNEYSWQPV